MQLGLVEVWMSEFKDWTRLKKTTPFAQRPNRIVACASQRCYQDPWYGQILLAHANIASRGVQVNVIAKTDTVKDTLYILAVKKKRYGKSGGFLK